MQKKLFKTNDFVTREILNVFTAIKQFKASSKKYAIDLKVLAAVLSENFPNNFPSDELWDPVLFLEKLNSIVIKAIDLYGDSSAEKTIYFETSYWYSLSEEFLSETLHSKDESIIKIPIDTIAPILEEISSENDIIPMIKGKLFRMANWWWSKNIGESRQRLKELISRGVTKLKCEKWYDIYNYPKYMTFQLNFDITKTIDAYANDIGLKNLKILTEYVPHLIPEKFELKSVFNLINSELTPMNSILSSNDAEDEKLCEWSSEWKWAEGNKDNPPNNKKTKTKTVWNLRSIIAYNKNHYVNFSKRDNDWYLFDDHQSRKVGIFDSMIECMMNSPFIPYIIMYETSEEVPRELSIISETFHESANESSMGSRYHLEEEKKVSSDLHIKPKGIYDFIREEPNEDGSSMSWSRNSRMPISELPTKYQSDLETAKIKKEVKKNIFQRAFDIIWWWGSKEYVARNKPPKNLKNKQKLDESQVSLRRMSYFQEGKLSDN